MDRPADGTFRQLLRFVRAGLALPASLPPAHEADWPHLIGLAERHGVLPLVQAGLGHLDERPPDAHAEYLKAVVTHRAFRTLALQAEAARLIELLGEADLPVMILKGVALRDAYGSVSLRPYVDNDLLIRQEDFRRFERLVVKQAGYVREGRAEWKKRGYLFVNGQYTFGRREGRMTYTLDAHVSVMPFGYRYSEQVTSLLDRSRTAIVGTTRIPVPSWEDQVIILCVNGLKDRWDRLRLVTDLVASASKVEDWDVVVAHARESNSLAAVSLGMALAREMFGFTAPGAPRLPEGRLVGLARDAADHLRSDTGPRHLTERERARLFLTAQDNLRARARYLAYTVLRRAAEPFLKGTGVESSELVDVGPG